MKHNHTTVSPLSGSKVNFAAPDPNAIFLTDIIFNLSNLVRFQGGMSKPWTVASHSVLVERIAHADNASMETQLWALMHDWHEAYTGDIPSPLKRYLRQQSGWGDVLGGVEQRLDRAIREAFDIPPPSMQQLKAVKGYDERAFEIEEVAFRNADHRDVFYNSGVYAGTLTMFLENPRDQLADAAKRHQIKRVQ